MSVIKHTHVYFFNLFNKAGLTNLESLNLDSCRIEDDGLVNLKGLHLNFKHLSLILLLFCYSVFLFANVASTEICPSLINPVSKLLTLSLQVTDGVNATSPIFAVHLTNTLCQNPF